MAQFREFTDVDWYGMAGATTFPDGSSPLVAEVKVDGLEATVVVDAEGVFVQVLTDDGEEVSIFHLEPSGIAARFTALLKDEYTTGELVDLGMSWERAA